MKIHSVKEAEQGTLHWLRLRVGKVTASELGNLLTPEFKPRTGETPKTYICEKVAERWRGEPLPKFGFWNSDQGHILETEAKPFYALEYGAEIQNVGFIDGDDERCGCSPDGLIGDDGGIEVKCPDAHTHVKYVLDGCVPKDYLAQVHGSLFVTGRKYWVFLSYRRKFPPLVVRVERDEAIMEKIGAALESFYKQFDEAMARLKAIADKPTP